MRQGPKLKRNTASHGLSGYLDCPLAKNQKTPKRRPLRQPQPLI